MAKKYDPISGRWIVSFSKRHPKTRQPVSRRRWADTKAEADRKERELITLVEKLIHSSVVPTWEVLAEDFLRSRLSQSLWTQKTHDSYADCLRAYTLEIWGGRHVDKITTEEIRKLVLEDSGIKSEGYREYLMKAIRGAFAYAVDKGILIRNPSPQMRFKRKTKLEAVLNREQVAILLQKSRELDWDWYPHVKMALYTGMRNGELYALRWNKVDLVAGRIKVDCSWNSISGFKETKSGDDRYVPIAPELRQFLEALKAASPSLEFVLPRSARWDNGEQARELRLFLRAIGLPSIRFHDLRATWATLLLATGVEAIKVMKIGGWKDYETMDRYLRLAGVDVQGALSAFSLEKHFDK